MLQYNYTLPLGSDKGRVFHGSRYSGNQVRLEIESALNESEHVTLDFSGVGVVTQSFIDEVLGVLILEHGIDILQRLSFKSCDSDVKAVIHYVVSTRAEDALKKQATLTH